MKFGAEQGRRSHHLSLPFLLILCIGRVQTMKILFVIIVSVVALWLGGCATDLPLVSDEDYNSTHGPAAPGPDPMAHIPQQSTRPPGF